MAQGAGREVLFGKEAIGLINLRDKRVGAGAAGTCIGQKSERSASVTKTRYKITGRTALIAQDLKQGPEDISCPTDAARLSASVWHIWGCAVGKP